MSYIESFKQYTGSSIANTFFIPIVTGNSADELGIKILYNMPVPTIVTQLKPATNVLQKYVKNGWNGGYSALKTNTEIPMSRVKAENAYSASDYFSLIYERLAANKHLNMDDLSGTELEQAETEMFREALREALRETMWLGDTTQSTGLNSFDGFLKTINDRVVMEDITAVTFAKSELTTPANIVKFLNRLWEASGDDLKSLRGEGNLVLFATSDLCDLYEKYLDECGVSSSYREMVDGRTQLSFHGIPMIDMRLPKTAYPAGLPQTQLILTDHRNLVLALNTQDFPGAEVRMWYNPDEMENRQRAIFMAGCEVLDNNLIMVGNIQ